MLATGDGNAMRSQATARRKRNSIIGIVEDLEVDTDLAEHLGWIAAQALQDGGNRLRRADPHGVLPLSASDGAPLVTAEIWFS